MKRGDIIAVALGSRPGLVLIELQRKILWGGLEGKSEFYRNRNSKGIFLSGIFILVDRLTTLAFFKYLVKKKERAQAFVLFVCILIIQPK